MTAPASSTLRTNQTQSMQLDTTNSKADSTEAANANLRLSKSHSPQPSRRNKSRSPRPSKTSHAIKHRIKAETTKENRFPHNSADSMRNSAKKQKIANRVANLKSNKATPHRETERRGAGCEFRRVPRQWKRRPIIHPRSKIKNQMARRRGSNPLHPPSSPHPTQKRSQWDQTFCRKWHINSLLWHNQT